MASDPRPSGAKLCNFIATKELCSQCRRLSRRKLLYILLICWLKSYTVLLHHIWHSFFQQLHYCVAFDIHLPQYCHIASHLAYVFILASHLIDFSALLEQAYIEMYTIIFGALLALVLGNWSERVAQGSQKGAKREPTGAKGSPKGAEREPKGAQRDPKGA